MLSRVYPYTSNPLLASVSVYFRESIMADTPSSTPAAGASTSTQQSKQPMIYICGGKQAY